MSEDEAPNEMLIPAAALRDSGAVEMLRVWIAERGLHCAIKVGMYQETKNIREEKAWGTILADVARHLADAMSPQYSANPRVALTGIREAFLNELDNPTSKVRGAFVDKV